METAEYRKSIERALKSVQKYNKSLDAQIVTLAGALRTIELANNELDTLTSTTITTVSRYGNETLTAHPVFKILKDAQDSVTKQMKALGLTVEDLSGSDENDPMVDLTRQVLKARRKNAATVGKAE